MFSAHYSVLRTSMFRGHHSVLRTSMFRAHHSVLRTGMFHCKLLFPRIAFVCRFQNLRIRKQRRAAARTSRCAAVLHLCRGGVSMLKRFAGKGTHAFARASVECSISTQANDNDNKCPRLNSHTGVPAPGLELERLEGEVQSSKQFFSCEFLTCLFCRHRTTLLISEHRFEQCLGSPISDVIKYHTDLGTQTSYLYRHQKYHAVHLGSTRNRGRHGLEVDTD
jgi:hypothetical protein